MSGQIGIQLTGTSVAYNTTAFFDLASGSAHFSFTGIPSGEYHLVAFLDLFGSGVAQVPDSWEPSHQMSVLAPVPSPLNIHLYDPQFEFHVSCTGDDSTGFGTETEPWRTIAYALTLVPDGNDAYPTDIYVDGECTWNEN